MRLDVVGATRRVPGLVTRLRRLASGLSRELALSGRQATVLLTDDEGISTLNRRDRGRREATDVLSFPSDDGGPYLGDVAISLDRAAEQGRDHGHGAAEEAEVLLIHGVLHLLGHDHETDRGAMRRLEARLCRSLLGGTRGLIARSARAARP